MPGLGNRQAQMIEEKSMIRQTSQQVVKQQLLHPLTENPLFRNITKGD